MHTGIFSAVARGYDRRAGVRLVVRQPSASTDSVKLLVAGRADAAVLDIHDLAIARERGRDVVGVLALVERPLAAVLAAPSVHTPRQLEGRRVGVTGLPSDDAVLRSIVRGAGGRPSRVRTVTIGFNAVAGVLTGRVAGATGFWNVEGVALRRRRPDYREFRVDSYGAPPYPELVVCVTRRTLRRHPELVRSLRRALTLGYRFVLAHPAAGVRDLTASATGLSRSVAAAQLAAVSPAMTLDGRFGVLDPRRLRAWATWEARFGIVRRPPDVARAFELSGAGHGAPG
ncbi:MAG TPA: ABC transporter substrate-binding protein [Solirubrobacteraceae bacterium]|nr:ABC transporter substrate-binding protein [Solirubrobacteraceae bacterium]